MENNLASRKNVRLRDYDYSNVGYYFITICAKNQSPLFGDIIDEKMHLSKYGEIAEIELLNIPTHYDNIKIDKYVIMPNHIHTIIIVGAALAQPELDVSGNLKKAGRASATPTIGNIIRGYKSGVSRKIGFSIWQRNYHEQIIRNEASYQNIWKYIDGNPATWKNDLYHIT